MTENECDLGTIENFELVKMKIIMKNKVEV